MSAFLCSSYHIGRLASFLELIGQPGDLDATEVAYRLATANVDSITSRYPDTLENFSGAPGVTLETEDGPAGYVGRCIEAAGLPWADGAHSAADMAKAFRCFAYQACEASTWDDSEAEDLAELGYREATARAGRETSTVWELEAPTRALDIPPAVLEAIDRGAALVLSMSGGKDSQAMASAVVHWLRETGRENPLHAVHADLGRAEWTETTETVRAQAAALGLELDIVQRHVRGKEPEDLLDLIEARAEKVGEAKPFWPSSQTRYCTSDMKRDPINKYIRSLGHSLVISVEGIRADESRARAAKPCWETRGAIQTKTRADGSRAREALTWRPVLSWTEADVWELLGGREGPLVHPAYALGNDRLSCSLCIFGSAGDLERGARAQPEYANALADLEARYGYTFTETTSILELCKRLGIRTEPEAAEAPEAPAQVRYVLPSFVTSQYVRSQEG